MKATKLVIGASLLIALAAAAAPTAAAEESLTGCPFAYPTEPQSAEDIVLCESRVVTQCIVPKLINTDADEIECA